MAENLALNERLAKAEDLADQLTKLRGQDELLRKQLKAAEEKVSRNAHLEARNQVLSQRLVDVEKRIAALTAPPSNLVPVSGTLVTRVRADIRARPGTGAPIVGRLPAEVSVTVRGQTVDKVWYRIELDGVRDAFVSAELLQGRLGVAGEAAGDAPAAPDTKIVTSRSALEETKATQVAAAAPETAERPDKPTSGEPARQERLAKLSGKAPEDSASSIGIRVFRPTGGVATALRFAGAPNAVIAGFGGGRLALLDVADGRVIRVFEGHKATIRAIAVAPDGRRVASGADDKSVRIWDVESTIGIRVLNGHTGRISSLAFMSDGRTLISGSEDGTARVWDVKRGEALMVFKAHKGVVSYNRILCTALK